MNKTETVVTGKGTTTIPQRIREECGIKPGSVLVWETHHGLIQARKRTSALNTMQKHILARAGTWDGAVSSVELLKMTRP